MRFSKCSLGFASTEAHKLSERLFTIVRMDRPFAGLPNEIVRRPTERRRPSWVDVQHGTLFIGDDEKVLGKSPKSITLLRLILHALGQRFVQLLQAMMHCRTLGLGTLSFRDFFRRNVDANNVSVMTL